MIAFVLLCGSLPFLRDETDLNDKASKEAIVTVGIGNLNFEFGGINRTKIFSARYCLISPHTPD